VKIFSAPHLHAKVFVFSRAAIIGSHNASRNSRDILSEAGVLTTDAEAVRIARRFIDGLGARPIHRQELTMLKKIYRRPKYTFSGAPVRKNALGPWLVPLVTDEWEDTDQKQAEDGRSQAKANMSHPRRSDLDEFGWWGKGFIEKAKIGDEVIQVLRDGRKYWIYRKGVIVGRRLYIAKGRPRGIFYLEIPATQQRISLTKIRQTNRRLARRLRRAQTPTKPGKAILQYLARFWPE